MSQGPLCPNLNQKVQKEVSQMANRNLSHMILLGGLSVNLNHLKVIKLKILVFCFFLTLNLTLHGLNLTLHKIIFFHHTPRKFRKFWAKPGFKPKR